MTPKNYVILILNSLNEIKPVNKDLGRSKMKLHRMQCKILTAERQFRLSDNYCDWQEKTRNFHRRRLIAVAYIHKMYVDGMTEKKNSNSENSILKHISGVKFVPEKLNSRTNIAIPSFTGNEKLSDVCFYDICFLEQLMTNMKNKL